MPLRTAGVTGTGVAGFERLGNLDLYDADGFLLCATEEGGVAGA